MGKFFDFAPGLFFEDPETVLRSRWHEVAAAAA
jgi:hypothetical protein